MSCRIVVLCALLACVGCEPSGPAGPEQTVKNYFPLAVGNRWVYQVTGTGQPPVTESVPFSMLNSHDVVVYVYAGSTGYTWYVSNDDGRIVARSNPDDETGRVWLCEPFEVGATWNLLGDLTRRVDDPKATVSVPAGTFEDCIKVSTWSDTVVQDIDYYAPGVGLVKESIPALAAMLELSDYEVK